MKHTALKILLCLTVIGPLAACDLNEPTWVNSSRVEVHEEGFTDSFDTSSLNNGTLRAIGVNYYRYGNGPMDIAVSFDPKSKTNTVGKAKSELSRIERELRRNGVGNVRAGITPAEGIGEKSTTLVSFPALTARPPSDCGMMPGYEDNRTDAPDNAEGEPQGYRMGCSIETMLARQVSRPGDMLGRPGFETNADALRQERVVWKRGYYNDASNPPLQGESVSESSN